MAESSRFWTTNGTGDGSAGGYGLQPWYDMLRKLFAVAVAEGVLESVDNELAVSGSTSPVTVATGAAVVYGLFYENTTALTLAVSTPAATTGFRVVLEANWTTQTVRAKVVSSSSGVTTPPALTQSAGSVWQISLATGTITSGGAISLTDDRSFAHFATRVNSAMLDTGAVTAGKIGVGGISAANQHAAGVVDSAAIASNAVTAGKIATGGVSAAGQFAAGVVDAAAIASNAVTTAKITDANVTTAKLAADSVDDTKAGDRVPQLYRRQGGDASSWAVAGTTTYTPAAVRMQCGVVSGATGGAGSGNIVVTFPQAFSQPPVILVTVVAAGAAPVDAPIAGSITASQFQLAFTGPNATSYTFSWLAIGAE